MILPQKEITISTENIDDFVLRINNSVHENGDPNEVHNSQYMQEQGLRTVVPGLQLELLTKTFADSIYEIDGAKLVEANFVFGNPFLVGEPTKGRIKLSNGQINVLNGEEKEVFTEANLNYTTDNLTEENHNYPGLIYKMNIDLIELINKSLGKEDFNPFPYALSLSSNVISKSIQQNNDVIDDNVRDVMLEFANRLEIYKPKTERKQLPVYKSHKLRLFSGAEELTETDVIYIDIAENGSDTQSKRPTYNFLLTAANMATGIKIYELEAVLGLMPAILMKKAFK